jgi:hypothetical protein
MRKATTSLSNAQIKALQSTPVTLIAAPGAGKIIVPISVILSLEWTADYGNIDANADISVLPEGGDGNLVCAISESVNANVSGLLQGSESRIASLCPPANLQMGENYGLVYTAAWLENQALVIKANNGIAGNFNGGDPANILKVTVLYDIVDL